MFWVCVCACECYQSDPKKQQQRIRCVCRFAIIVDTVVNIYLCPKHAFQIIFTVGFPSILVLYAVVFFFFFSHEHIFTLRKIHSFCFCCSWDECRLICMRLVIIVTFCHISRLIFLSLWRSCSLLPFELIRILGLFD